MRSGYRPTMLAALMLAVSWVASACAIRSPEMSQPAATTQTRADLAMAGARAADGAPAVAQPSTGRRVKPTFDGTGILIAPSPIEGNSPGAVYPSQARIAGREGMVTIRATITVDGIPVDLSIEESSGFADLDAAALEAAKNWRFHAATWNGKPVEHDVLMPFRFHLRAAKP
jgi:TonB family protein